MAVLYKIVAKHIPELKLKLAQARMSDSPEHYVKKTSFTALLLGVAISFILFAFTKDPWMFVAFPLFYVIAFWYFLHYADAKITRIQREVSKEIVFAGRFLIIELESGVPVYQAFNNVAKNYETIGMYFSEVIQRVDLGTSMEEALNEAVQVSPSNDMRRIFWQVLNSMKTGSEVAPALNNVFDQIVREQQIAVKEYGRKLNPIAMFYMMMAIIVPSLGTIMVIVLSTFIGFEMNALFFGILIGMSLIVQFMFLAIIRTQRPPVDI